LDQIQIGRDEVKTWFSEMGQDTAIETIATMLSGVISVDEHGKGTDPLRTPLSRGWGAAAGGLASPEDVEVP
jgi:hypothetical protein